MRSVSRNKIWPPHRPIDPAWFAVPLVGDPRRYSGDWWQVMEEDNKRRAANEAKWREEEAKRQ